MCTEFSVKTTNGDVFVGRSMENGQQLHSRLFFRSKGHKYNQWPLDQLIKCLKEHDTSIDWNQESLKEENFLSWEGLYGFVGINYRLFSSKFTEELGLASDGMNTEGLATGDLTLIGTEYQSFDSSGSNNLMYMYLVNWILSTCASCEEVKEKIKNVCVVSPLPNHCFGALLIHFPVHDRFGKSIVIEYVNGELHLYDNDEVGVLTNDPTFDWQITNLKNYVGITPNNVTESKKGNNFPQNNRDAGKNGSQGTGFLGLPGSSTPPDRFIRAAMMSNYADVPKNSDEATSLAFHILNTVDIPKGTSRKNSVFQDFTQWAVVANLSELIYSVRMYDSPQVYSVNLNQLKDELSHPGKIDHKYLKLSQSPISIDITDEVKL